MIIINGKKDDTQQELFLLHFLKSIEKHVIKVKNYVHKEEIYSIENKEYKLFYLEGKYLCSDVNANLNTFRNIYDLTSTKYIFYRKIDDIILTYSFYLSDTVNIRSNLYNFILFDDYQSYVRISGYLKDKMNIRHSEYVDISNTKEILRTLINSKMI